MTYINDQRKIVCAKNEIQARTRKRYRKVARRVHSWFEDPYYVFVFVLVGVVWTYSCLILAFLR